MDVSDCLQSWRMRLKVLGMESCFPLQVKLDAEPRTGVMGTGIWR